MSLNLAPFCRDMRIQENYENLEGGKEGGGGALNTPMGLITLNCLS